MVGFINTKGFIMNTGLIQVTTIWEKKTCNSPLVRDLWLVTLNCVHDLQSRISHLWLFCIFDSSLIIFDHLLYTILLCLYYIFDHLWILTISYSSLFLFIFLAYFIYMNSTFIKSSSRVLSFLLLLSSLAIISHLSYHQVYSHILSSPLSSISSLFPWLPLFFLAKK